ncbi:hypothetical protein PFTANZ_06441, partial [Plasmodium falciparum Tanzania (2000708)]
MKELMQDFDRQTLQRYKEYDERMIKKKQKCKEQCDKEIQKIILKDKLEKELMDKFATLQTDIQNDAIPTCVCEKSLADKVEKTCLKCGGVLGGGVTPAWGLVSGLWYASWIQYVTKAPIQKGIEAVISILEDMPGITDLPGFNLANIVNQTNYLSSSLLTTDISAVAKPICDVTRDKVLSFCSFTSHNGGSIIAKVSDGAESAVSAGKQAASAELANLAQKTPILTNTIIFSFVAIVVIVLVMLIIYLIL